MNVQIFYLLVGSWNEFFLATFHALYIFGIVSTEKKIGNLFEKF